MDRFYYTGDKPFDVPETIGELPPCPCGGEAVELYVSRDCRVVTASVHCPACDAWFFSTDSMLGSDFDDTRAVCAKYIAWRKDPDSLVGYRGNGEWT